MIGNKSQSQLLLTEHIEGGHPGQILRRFEEFLSNFPTSWSTKSLKLQQEFK
jgi:hypothetical protein